MIDQLERELLDPLTRLTQDLKRATVTLGPRETRFLVDTYYQIQDYRKAADNQERSLIANTEPHEVISWVGNQVETLEGDIKRALDAYSSSSVVGRWSKSICGIGPVISAGLLAHIDIEQAPTVGHIWRFAGLDPTSHWEKKTKRPWNASLKVLCWKIGQSFMKFQNNPNDFYGKMYVERKAYEVANNESGSLADQAAAALGAKRIGKDTEAYKAYSVGKLPPAHIDARARRWVSKLFLAHWHRVAYYDRYAKESPKPYVLTLPGHSHEVVCPNWPF